VQAMPGRAIIACPRFLKVNGTRFPHPFLKKCGYMSIFAPDFRHRDYAAANFSAPLQIMNERAVGSGQKE